MDKKFMTVDFEERRCECCGRWFYVEPGFEIRCPYKRCSKKPTTPPEPKP